MSSNQKDLTTGSVPRRLLLFAIPFLLSNLLQALYNAADMIIVGQFCGPVSISGVTIGGQVTNFMIMLISGFVVGGTVQVGQYHGSKQVKDQREAIATMFTFFLIVGGIATVVMLLSYRSILNLLNTDPIAFDEAAAYLYVSVAGTIFVLGYNAVSAVLRGMGDSKRPLYFVIISSVMNVLLDLVFVGMLGFGAGGAAMTTVVAQAFSFACAVYYLRRSNFVFDFKPSSFRIYPDKLKTLVKIGLPVAIQSSIASFSFLTLTSIVNAYGYVATSVYGVAGRITNFGIMPNVAISGAISSMAAQNIGAGDHSRARQTMLSGLALCFCFSIPLALIVSIFPDFFLRAFTTDSATIAMGVPYLRVFSLDFLLTSFAFSFNGLFTGAGHTKFSLFNNICNSLLLRVPFAYLMAEAMGLGLAGTAWGVVFSSAGSTLISLAYFSSGRWKQRVMHVAPALTPEADFD